MRVTQAGKKYGWDAPLTLEIAADANAFANAFGDAAPVGKHEHDRMRGEAYQHRARTAKRQTEYPRRGGRLRDWLLKSQNWQIKRDPRTGKLTGASISILLAYARIIDRGGTIPPVNMPSRASTKNAKAMAFNAGGQDVVTKYRRGYNIAAQNYSLHGLQNFTDARGAAGLIIGWRPNKNGD